MCLQYHFAGQLITSCTTGYLHHQLPHTFQRAEVSTVQCLVEIDDDHQGHLWEMMALGQHLGSHQQTGPTGFDLSGKPLEFAFPAHAVPVKA